MGEECAIPDCPHKKLWEVATDVFKEERDKWVIEKRGLERRLKEALTAPQPHVGVEVELVHEMNPVLEDLKWWQHTSQNYNSRGIFTDGWNAAISHLMEKYGNRIKIIAQKKGDE